MVSPAAHPTGLRPGAAVAETAAHDVWVYRIITIGLAAVLLAWTIGLAFIVADGKKFDDLYWVFGTTVSGTLIGILVPQSERKPPPQPGWRKAVWSFIRTHNVPLLLVAVFAASLSVGASLANDRILGLAAAAGGALVGYLVPSPVSARRPPDHLTR
jgi:hypothetical protein